MNILKNRDLQKVFGGIWDLNNEPQQQELSKFEL
jgi:hypothetical protein